MVASARFVRRSTGPRVRVASAAADLPRPSAGEASPYTRTSDALRHAVVAGLRALLARSDGSPAKFDSRLASPPRQARRCLGLFKASTTHEPGRLPLARSSCLAAEADSHALTVRLLALAPHPFTHRESVLLVREEPPRQATLR
jgi:hypothetical protein